MPAELAAYLAQDRCLALARGAALPDRTHGTALFADISGFTALTELLAQALTPRRGAETLTLHLNAVYDALITEIERFGGSVLTFSGDALTCWFDDAQTPAAPRAATCALALQQTMRGFASVAIPNGRSVALGLKVALASGPVRRFVVGDPTIQLIDVLAGMTIDRMAAVEHMANRGEIVLDAATAALLADQAFIAEWRADGHGEQVAVLSGLRTLADAFPWPILLPDALTTAQLQPWVLPAVLEREQAGLGEFLTELRPAATLFLKFEGIAYDHDAAGAQLNRFISAAQDVLARYDGVLLQLTIGDKGAYLIVSFGAPVAHEHAQQRAAAAALELRTVAADLGILAPVQIGVSYGTLRTGAYGGRTRRTYSVIGDEVNLAARLMQLAQPGEIIVSGLIQAACAATFVFEARPPATIKGKADPLPVFALIGVQQQRPGQLQAPAYALPMVGRQAELALIGDRLNMALAGRGQAVLVSAEAGMGKSRLIAEALRLAQQHGVIAYGGAGRSESVSTPYSAWIALWQALFDVDPSTPLRRRLRLLEGLIDDWAPERIDALPLLGPLLDLPISHNEFTHALEPQDRKNTLHALLLECLAGAAREAHVRGGGLLLVLEDLHWMDAVSYELLADLLQRMRDLPILILLAQRPSSGIVPNPLATIGQADPALLTWIDLQTLDPDAMLLAIRAKLVQLFPAWVGAPPPALVERITQRAAGNPFYLEELLNYVRDRGIDLRSMEQIAALELPTSLHQLILSRIDQLATQQQLTLKIASVLGRRFGMPLLQAIYPTATVPEQLIADLGILMQAELTLLEAPEPELRYLFKHIVTQEVAYESLAYATRAVLHEQVGVALEYGGNAAVGGGLDLLAYHFGRSENHAKQRYYYRRAAEAAAARYANQAALEYLARALALAPLDDQAERYRLLLVREQIHGVLADRTAQQADLNELAVLAEALHDDRLRAEVLLRQANYAYRIGDYTRAIAYAEQAHDLAERIVAPELGIRAQQEWVWALIRRGAYTEAQQRAEICMRQAEQLGDRSAICHAARALSEIAGYRGERSAERTYAEQALTLARELGDRRTEGAILNNLGATAMDQGDYAAAQEFQQHNLTIARQIANHWNEALALGNLGYLAITQGDYVAAQRYLEECLRLMRAGGDRWGEALTACNMSAAAHFAGDDNAALQYARTARTLAEEIGDLENQALAQFVLGEALLGSGNIAEARSAYQASLELRQQLNQPHMAAEVRAGLARVALAEYNVPEALEQAEAILAYQNDGGTLDGMEHPLLVPLTCVRVLNAVNDPRAATVIQAAYTLLAARAEKITDADARRRFLEQVPYHRELRALAVQAHP